MYSNVVRETASEIRALARRALKGNWGNVFLGVFVFYLLMNTVPELLDSVFSFNKAVSNVNVMEMLENGSIESFSDAVEAGGLDMGTSVSGLYSLALSGAFGVGMCSFMLAFFRKNDIKAGYVFNGFECYLKTLALTLLVALFTFLWSLLFIIPGIIAAFRYSQAFYILADDPSKGVMQCLEESKRIMTGNKWKYFCVNLSFIGWYIVAGFSSGLILTLLNLFTIPIGIRIISILAEVVAAIPVVFLFSYVQTACTAFFDLASGNLIARPSRPDAIEVESVSVETESTDNSERNY